MICGLGACSCAAIALYSGVFLLLTWAGFSPAEGQNTATSAHPNEVEHFALLIGINDYAQASPTIQAEGFKPGGWGAGD